jgi:hypothetical protein
LTATTTTTPTKNRYRKPLILFLGEEGGEIELALDEELEDIRIAKSLDDVSEEFLVVVHMYIYVCVCLC